MFLDGGLEGALLREPYMNDPTYYGHQATPPEVFYEEHLKGSLEPGKLADVIILDPDILRCPEDKIKDAEVLVTLLGGTVVQGTLDALGRS